MAHANIFQKVNKPAAKTARNQDSLDSSTLETIQALGEQVLSLREIIEEQHLVIENLASTVSALKDDQKETSQNLNLAYIDQKDLAKQLRILRSNLEANQFVRKKERPKAVEKAVKNDREIEELFFKNAKNSTVMKNSEASDAVKKTLAELKKLEKPKQKFLAKKVAEQRALEAHQQKLRAAIGKSPAIKKDAVSKKLSNEDLAKKMIFGKTSKLIK